jgi:hypothetical protein
VLRKDSSANWRKPKWTSEGRGRAKNKGWDTEGVARYNVLVLLVKKNRESDLETEKKYMNSKRGARAAKLSRKLKRKLDALQKREEGLLEVEDGFSD